MKKVGIATITIMVDNENAYNYGNKLQMFALQEFIRENGYKPETIRYKMSSSKYAKKSANKRVHNISDCMQLADDAFRIAKRKVYRKKLSGLVNQRKRKFNEFVNRNIQLTDTVYNSESDFSSLNKSYDFYITGSDQVWNPYFEGSNPFYYLGYAPKGKRIAYAPSIAVSEIPVGIKAEYKEWLNQIDYLSIREESGKNLIKKEFNLDAALVCDPVFLVSSEKWSKIAGERVIKEPYIALYMLGKNMVWKKKLIKTLAKMLALKVVDIYTRDNLNSEFAGPEEFLSLIKNSELLITDSFHGTAFATIFKRPVVIINRDKIEPAAENVTDNRINTMLALTGTENRSIQYIIKHPDELYNVYPDYDKLNKLVDQSKHYLLKALQLEGDK